MTFDETTDTIFALDQTTRTLLTIDPSTGAGATIGHFAYGAANGLATQPIGGDLIADVGVDPSFLARMDKTTGAATLIGSTGTNSVSGLEFHPISGELFCYAQFYPPVGTHLATLDPTTGSATRIGRTDQISALEFVEWPSGPYVASCDVNGVDRDQFMPGEGVYIKASGLEGSTGYTISIQDDPVDEGDALVLDENPSTATPKLVPTEPDGSLPATLIWAIPPDAPVTYDEWDIIIDRQDDGDNTGKYNSASDGIDSLALVGFVAPVPELSTIILLGAGLMGLSGYFALRRHRNRRTQAL
ncbi:hypothetical protein ACFLX5_03300 [Chloroflexota bacterium]